MRTLKRVLALVLAVLMILPSFVTVLAENVSVDGVTLNRASSYLAVGDTITLKAAVTPSNATDTSVTWSISDENVATIVDGVVTAVAEGEAIVKVTTADGGFEATSKIVVSELDIRNHVTSPNPETDFRSLFDKDSFEVYLPFEDDLTDKTGNTTSTVTGTLKYADGYYGKAAQFTSDGNLVSPYIDITGAELGTEPTTIAFWFKKNTSDATEQPWLMTSSSDSTSGFRIYATDYPSTLSSTDIFSMIVNGTACHARSNVLPSDLFDGWSHIAYVKGNASLKIYVDFKLANTFSNTNMKNYSLAGDLGIRLGNNADGTYYDYQGLMDDFIVYNGVMTADDITALGQYYGVGVETVNVEGISLDKSSLCVAVGDTAKLNVSYLPEDATTRAIEWTSSDDTVATVDNGTVTALAQGETTITATSLDGGFTAECKVKVLKMDIRNHVTEPNPETDFRSLFDADSFEVYLPFEDNLTDKTGNTTAAATGALKYADGYYGKAAKFEPNASYVSPYVDITGAELGTAPTTIAFWFKKDVATATEQPVLMSSYSTGTNGFRIRATDYTNATADIFSMFLNGSEFHTWAGTSSTSFPKDMYDGWSHIAYVKGNASLKLYVDFKLVKTFSNTNLKNMSLAGDVGIRLGYNADGTYYDYRGLLDDFFVYNGAMTADELTELGKYYGIGLPTVNLEGIALDKTEVYAVAGDTVKLNASFTPADATFKTIEWSSSNEAVATVENGVVTMLTAGETTITATAADGGYTASCDIYVNDTVSPRAHTMVEAPAAIGGVEFTNLFDADKFRVYLPFENNVINMSDGDCTPVAKDDDYYGMRYDNGFYGKAARLDDGYIELNTDIDKESVTIGTWIKADKINTSVFLSNYGKASPEGFDIKIVDSVTETVNNSNATLYIKDGEKQVWVTARQDKGKIPTDAFEGWMHIAYTIDRKANQIILYCDFKETYRLAISSELSLANDVYDLVLGRPADANPTTRFFGAMDDFFIYDDVLSADDMLTLRDYYGIGGQTPVESISLNKNTVNLDINGAEQLTATILPANAVNRAIEWTTSAPEIATVRDGKITANATGTATITAKTVDGNYTATCTVNVSENTTRYIYDQVVIFGIDGAGTWFDQTPTPNVDRIFGDCANTYNGLTNNPSISSQSWATILNGSLPEYHKRNNSNTMHEAYPEDSAYPTIFRLAREKFPTADLANYASYESIYMGCMERNVGVSCGSGDTYPETQQMALDYLNNKEDGRPPKVLFFYTGVPDSAGHAGGYGPQFPKYLDAITESDSYIGPIYDWYVENGYADNTLFIVCTDHGGTPTVGGGGHGQLSEAEMYVYAGVSGRTVMKNSEIKDWENRDVAAIVAYALGMDIPETWSARVPDGVFADVVGMERNEVPYISSPIRNHVTEETPALDSGEHLTDVFDAVKFNILAEFDGNINDTTGNHATTQVGTITYEDGYFGQGANFSEGGYITTEDCHIATESFTIGFWLKYDMSDYTEDMKKTAVICSTYDLKNYWKTPGFAIHTKEEHNLGFRQARTGIFTSNGATNPTVWKQLENWHFPDYDNKWVHYMFTFDRKTNKLTQYVDFKFHYTEPVSLKDSDLTNVPLIIGQNTTLDYTALKGSLDDFFIYKEAMTTEDIAKLAAYYGADKEAYVESIALSQNSAELNAGNTLTLTATVLPEDAMVKNVIWTSSNEAVATVENGVVTAIRGGNATITATTVDGGFTAQCEITVISSGEEEPDAELVGSSLVLDGRIGVKVYMAVNEATVDRAELKVTTVNSDYVCNETSPNYSSLYRVESVVTPTKDEETGKYYAILYVPAKDIDNISFDTVLRVYLKSDVETAVTVQGASFDVETYIAAAKALAEAGDADFVEALPLVESLENYGKYAENYFNGGSLADYRSKADSIVFLAPRRSETVLDGVEFYGTSLILEDNVTIRHYFDVTDIDAFNAAYTCDIEYGKKGGYIYFDIEDINAQSIGVPQVFTIRHSDGSVAFTVEYSVGNYIANMLNSSDSRLVSLVSAMYDYYVEAYSYNGSKEFISDKDETLPDSWTNQ